MDQTPSFEQWVAAHERSLLRTAWLLSGNAATAEDLVQTALLKCWPTWPRIAAMADPAAYVRQVLTRSYLSWWRRRWRGEIPTPALSEGSVPADDGAAEGAVDDQRVLAAALARLPRGQRAAVVLRFAEDLSEAQTATVLGCSVGTVKSQTSRGLRSLREDPTLLREVDRL